MTPLYRDERLRQAVASLLSHRMRSILAVLGIVFGSAAVIAMLAIGAGARREAMSLLSRLGLTNVFVIGREYGQDQIRDIREKSEGLRVREVKAAKEIFEECNGTYAFAGLTPQVLSAQGRTAGGKAIGGQVGFLKVIGLKLARGRYFDEADSNHNVCIIGSTLANRLFPAQNPIGGAVRVDERVFKVVGLLADQDALALGGAFELTPAETVFVPLPVFRNISRHWTRPEVDGAVLSFSSPEQTRGTADPLRRYFKRLHGGVEDMQIVVPENLLREKQRTQRVFTIVMTAIAGISMLVGGIGITNIMLASVLERVREIGVRRAVGATQADIRALFLTEALLLCLFGGFTGVIVGQLLAWAISALAGWPMAFSFLGIALSLVLSLVVGVLSGVWPARRAAALDPIEALRYE